MKDWKGNMINYRIKNMIKPKMKVNNLIWLLINNHNKLTIYNDN